MAEDPKDTLNRYLRRARADLLAKLDGLSERQVRLPLTGTGTNLLGLVKHVASIEIGYLGETFGRTDLPDLPWYAEGEDANADLWVRPDESREQILALHAESVRIAEATIAGLDLDARGSVPWWGECSEVTLHQVLVHVLAEVARHAGHADILREELDGRAGNDDGNLPPLGDAAWVEHRARVQAAADEFSDEPPVAP